MARREARRHAGRSALIVVMIGLPVLVLSFAAVTYDMFELTVAERLEREIGRADAVVHWVSDRSIEQSPDGGGWSGDETSTLDRAPTDAELLALLPPGSRLSPIRYFGVRLRTVAGIGQVAARGLDLADPLTEGIAVLLAGRPPVTADEVALTGPASTRLGARLGDTVEHADSGRRFTVVGVVEFPRSLTALVVFRPGALTPAELGGASPAGPWLVDSPEPITWDLVRRLNQSGILVTSREVLLHPPQQARAEADYERSLAARELGIGVLVAGLGLLEVVLLAGPAFAVGARRRQRQLALVAANGATPAQIRRIVLADGLVLGVAGALAGVALGILLAFAARPLIETYLVSRRAGGYRVFPLALGTVAGLAVVTGLLGALVPAFTAARQSVVAALSGRPGVARSRRRWLVLGLLMIGAGGAVAMAGAWQISANIMLTGLVLGELGLVVCTPALVGLVARFGRVLPLGPRLALRDTARNRAAAAPAISAVMAAVAGSVALGVYLSSNDAARSASYVQALPHGHVLVAYRAAGTTAAERSRPVPTDEIERALREHLPAVEVFPVSTVACPTASSTGLQCFYHIRAELPPEQLCPYTGRQGPLTAGEIGRARRDPRCESSGFITSFGSGAVEAIVDDGTALPGLTGATAGQVAEAARVLRAGGVVINDSRFVVNGSVSVTAQAFGPTESRKAPDQRLSLPAAILDTGLGLSGRLVLSEAAAIRLGAEVVPYGFIVATSRMPTQAEQDALAAVLRDLGSPDASPAPTQPPASTPDVPTPDLPTASFWVERGPPGGRDPTLVVLAIAAGVITLGAAGVATGLAAADGRRELSTLAAVGASPRLRRVLSLSQSGVISGLGSLLGATAGLGAAVAVLAALNERYAAQWPAPAELPIAVPWLSLTASLLVVPLVAMLGAGLLTRSRLPIERRPG